MQWNVYSTALKHLFYFTDIDRDIKSGHSFITKEPLISCPPGKLYYSLSKHFSKKQILNLKLLRLIIVFSVKNDDDYDYYYCFYSTNQKRNVLLELQTSPTTNSLCVGFWCLWPGHVLKIFFCVRIFWDNLEPTKRHRSCWFKYVLYKIKSVKFLMHHIIMNLYNVIYNKWKHKDFVNVELLPTVVFLAVKDVLYGLGNYRKNLSQ